MFRLYLLFTITFQITTLIYSQTEWTKYENNPILTPGGAGQSVFIGHSSVIYHDGLYKMWYDGADNGSGIGFQIFYATSEDGKTWTKYDSGSVLGYGNAGEWDERNAFGSEVIYRDSLYKMWYVSRAGHPWNGKLGYAESEDGINWVKYPGNPVVTWGDSGSFDQGGISYPSVKYYDGLYHMWYSGWDGITLRLGYASSPDGIEWTRYDNNPVLDLGNEGEFDESRITKGEVLIINDLFHLWYTANFGTGAAIGYATSTDGKNWRRYHRNPVLTADDNTWEETHIATGSMMFSSDNIIKMWYSAGGNTIRAKGYATSIIAPIREHHVLRIPPTHWIAGDTVPVPLVMNRVTAVAGIDFAVVYDTTLLSFVSYDNSDVTSDFIFEVNSSIPGSLAVSMASSTALSAADRLHSIIGEMSFLIDADAQPADTAFIDFTSAALADTGGSPIRVSTVDGFVTVPIDGDVNLDGHITSGDAVIALRSAIGAHNPSDIEFIMADRDTNGVINELDAMCLLRLAVGLDCELIGGSSGVTVSSHSPFISGTAGQFIEVEILFEGAIDLAAGSFDLLIPEDLIKVNSVQVGDMEDNLLISSNRSGDNFMIGFVNTDGLTNSDGRLMILSLELLQDVPGMTLTLSGNRLFNESGQNMEMSVITGIKGEDVVNPESFRLEQNYPNPFNPVTSIGYFLPSQSHVLLTVYNMRGEEVIRLVNEEMSIGYHTVEWNASNSASGIYFYRLQTGDFVETKKLVLLK